jgi:hypothetical protein
MCVCTVHSYSIYTNCVYISVSRIFRRKESKFAVTSPVHQLPDRSVTAANTSRLFGWHISTYPGLS